jgi:endonuclease/exonuclease/phosphatase family metal-dependent hydrolase
MKSLNCLLVKTARGAGILLAVLFFTGGNLRAEELSVMTRNLYLGAEIMHLASATTPEEFQAGAYTALMEVAANNFPERATALAAEIMEKKPQLIGLQEVSNFTLDGENPGLPFTDYLSDLLAALGGKYYKAAEVENFNITIPIPGIGLVGLADRDVILARWDVEEPQPVDLSQWCRSSEDGCNYTVSAGVENSPVGPINFERGFVGVHAKIGDLPVIFINTHLEIRNPDPANPLSAFFQAAQAHELISLLNVLNAYLNPERAPIILVGDFNSSPEDQVLYSGQIVPPYLQLMTAGYLDAWTLRPGSPPGLTCCQENLRDPEAALYERVDLILTNRKPEKVQVNVVGNDGAALTQSGLWPSDHAGVAARMSFED